MIVQESRNSLAVLIVAWLVVGLPAAWGVEQTLHKSLDLFRAPAPAASAPVVQAVPQPPGR